MTKPKAKEDLLPVGRPTDYVPEMGEKLLGYMSKGFSITAAAAAIGHHKDTIYEWAKKHPEFSDALKLGRGSRVLKLEHDLLAAKDGPNVTSRIFALKNADPSEWRDKHDVEHSGNVTVKIVEFKESDL